ncbi:hypothetical protein G6F37_001112 [Rhizopus arrhizus]|nr:hypothetical protein G6F38_009509 [Rhizopus arrhizus]KAG1163553.1 hypothetical protein G6F37_001112 [Rhizopus arrhizus]
MSTTEWTVLEKLLLSQAVYKYGEDNWFQIARNLKHHALLDRPSDYFNQKNCSLQYYLMIEDMDKEKRQQSLMMQDMPVVVRLARQLYSQRLEELKKAISEDEEKFLVLVSEIEDIRSGKLDNQLLRNENAEEQGSEPIENESTEPLEDKKQDEHQMEKKKEITDKADNEKPSSDGIEDHTMSENDRIEENNMLNQPENPKEEKIQEVQYNEEPEIKKESMDDKVEKEKKITDATEEIPTTLIEQKNATDNKNDSDQSPAIENTQPEQVGDMTSDAVKTSRKRVADEDALTSYELETKRARREEQISSDVDHEIENAPLTVDTARTDYSTDAEMSQGTTPADVKDGYESVGGSESNAPTPTNERSINSKKPNKDDPRYKSWLKNINLLWREIANHKNGAMFMNPIKESIAPQYYDIVKSPMDLKTIKNRIRDGLINTTTEFERDVILMLTNSLMYNTEGTEVYQMAKEMLDDSTEKLRIFKTADEDTSASTHTRASSMAAKDRRKSLANE